MADRDDKTWIAELKGERGKQKQEQAFQDLGNILLRRVRWRLSASASLPPSLAKASDLDQFAQDIVQESLMRIWEKGLDQYKGKAKFTTFATVIALNLIRDKLRRLWRHIEEPIASFDDEGRGEEDDDRLSIAIRSKMVAAELPPEREAQLRKILQCVDRILAERCSFRERRAFVMKHIDGLKSKEISQLIDTTVGAVYSLTFNARQKLRQGLEEEGYTLETIHAILN